MRIVCDKHLDAQRRFAPLPDYARREAIQEQIEACPDCRRVAMDALRRQVRRRYAGGGK